MKERRELLTHNLSFWSHWSSRGHSTYANSSSGSKAMSGGGGGRRERDGIEKGTETKSKRDLSLVLNILGVMSALVKVRDGAVVV